MHSGILNFKFSIVFKSAAKNKTKIKETDNFYAKAAFDQINFGSSKQITVPIYMKFSLFILAFSMNNDLFWSDDGHFQFSICLVFS